MPSNALGQGYSLWMGKKLPITLNPQPDSLIWMPESSVTWDSSSKELWPRKLLWGINQSQELTEINPLSSGFLEFAIQYHPRVFYLGKYLGSAAWETSLNNFFSRWLPYLRKYLGSTHWETSLTNVFSDSGGKYFWNLKAPFQRAYKGKKPRKIISDPSFNKI